ncbi:MAG: hypothetical protein ABRQ37_17645 [Candidatus Eremiobacterota bacterium]
MNCKALFFLSFLLCFIIYPAEAEDNFSKPLISDIQENTDLIDYVLSKENLTRGDIHTSRFTVENLLRKNTAGLFAPHFKQCWEDPFYFPKFTKRVCNDLAKNWKGDKGIYNILLASEERTGFVAGRLEKYMPSLKVESEKPMEKALQKLYVDVCGKDFNDNIFCRVNGKDYNISCSSLPASDIFSPIPMKVQKLIAEHLLAHLTACKYRNRAFREMEKETFNQLYSTGRYHFLSDRDKENKVFLETVEKETGEDSIELEYDIAEKFDYNDMYFGGLPLLMNIINIKKFLSDPKEDPSVVDGKETQGKSIDISGISVECDTPFGRFAFCGSSEDNTYDCNKYFSVIDTGGNDLYKGPAAASLPDRPSSALIDMSGNDNYISTKEDPSSQGSGMMGYGILVDCQGDDLYKSYDNSQGSAFFGVGLLWDEGGNDSFTGRNMTQGAGAYGIGNLVNIGGKDTYYCFQCGQAFGYVRGCGVLLDTEGDDIYTGETGHENPEENLVNPADLGHDSKRNYSFVQGAGWGRRGDLSDGHSMGGGTGILVDMTGNDHYECGVYGQATGYWYGTGILCDAKGDDSYEGSFYVQSGTAHMGMTELLDEEGNDTYRVWKAISQGGAHDFSLSWFIDKKGNDKYLCFEEETDKNGHKVKTSGGVMIGSAITNSLAFHIDYEGDDLYEAVNSTTLGYCLMRSGPDSYRYDEWTCGIMIDRGGNDTYIRNIDRNTEKDVPDAWPVPANNSLWQEICRNGNRKFSFGTGLDCLKGTVKEAEY